MEKKNKKIGVLLVGMNGCVGNTTVAGHQLIIRENLPTFGMITELNLFNKIDIPKLTDFVILGWDIKRGSAYENAIGYDIIPKGLIEKNKKNLSTIKPFKGIVTKFDHPSLSKDNICPTNNLREAVDILISNINVFRKKENISEIIVVYLASPTKDCPISSIHSSLKKFELALSYDTNPPITTGMIYCYAALKANCAFIDFSPNPTLEVPCLLKLAEFKNVPIVGRDGSTGQTLIKSVLAEMLSIRNLRLKGWFSTNILGNHDGFILSQTGYNKIKLNDKTNVLSPILGYRDFDHVVEIEYYPPRGDNKEAWDNVDFLGWLGMGMNFKINWQGRDSILAAPLVLDLVRLVAHAMKNKEKGLLKYLGIFFKNPIGTSERGFFKNWLKFCSHYKSKYNST